MCIRDSRQQGWRLPGTGSLGPQVPEELRCDAREQHLRHTVVVAFPGHRDEELDCPCASLGHWPLHHWRHGVLGS
eukprot:14986899-Heterocapsa_arctica.AAC.1